MIYIKVVSEVIWILNLGFISDPKINIFKATMSIIESICYTTLLLFLNTDLNNKKKLFMEIYN